MGSIVDSRRRWFGLFFLLLAAGMLIWGQTWFRSRLQGLAFVFYWLVCLLLTVLALVVALLDARATRRRLRSEQAELLRKTFSDGGAKSGESGEPRKRR